jgi:hypothetical protein
VACTASALLSMSSAFARNRRERSRSPASPAAHESAIRDLLCMFFGCFIVIVFFCFVFVFVVFFCSFFCGKAPPSVPSEAPSTVGDALTLRVALLRCPSCRSLSSRAALASASVNPSATSCFVRRNLSVDAVLATGQQQRTQQDRDAGRWMS